MLREIFIFSFLSRHEDAVLLHGCSGCHVLDVDGADRFNRKCIGETELYQKHKHSEYKCWLLACYHLEILNSLNWIFIHTFFLSASAARNAARDVVTMTNASNVRNNFIHSVFEYYFRNDEVMMNFLLQSAIPAWVINCPVVLVLAHSLTHRVPGNTVAFCSLFYAFRVPVHLWLHAYHQITKITTNVILSL